MNSIELFFIVRSKNPKKEKKVKTLAVTYFQAKNVFF